MTPNAQIEITISVDHAGAKLVSITNNRPVQAAQLFIGKRVSEALRIIPLLFNVCGKAQGFASVTAIEQALDVPVTPECRIARQIISDYELIREHLLRIFLDWSSFMPEEFNSSDMSAELQALMALQPQFEQALFDGAKPFDLRSRCKIDPCLLKEAARKLEALLSTYIYGAAPQLWLAAESRDVVLHWMRNAKTLAGKSCGRIVQEGLSKTGAPELSAVRGEPVPFLPPLPVETLHAELFNGDAERFIHHPTFKGRPHETSALSRHHSHPLLCVMMHNCGTGLLTRQIARLVEVAVVYSSIQEAVARLCEGDCASVGNRQTAGAFQDHQGIAQTEASRGLLVHGVELENQSEDPLIKDYRILAPTEWNFHPQGALAASLASLPGYEDSEIRPIADMLISSIDPCTGTKLEVRHA